MDELVNISHNNNTLEKCTHLNILPSIVAAQLAGAIEYTNCISAEG